MKLTESPDNNAGEVKLAGSLLVDFLEATEGTLPGLLAQRISADISHLNVQAAECGSTEKQTTALAPSPDSPPEILLERLRETMPVPSADSVIDQRSQKN